MQSTCIPLPRCVLVSLTLVHGLHSVRCHVSLFDVAVHVCMCTLTSGENLTEVGTILAVLIHVLFIVFAVYVEPEGALN